MFEQPFLAPQPGKFLIICFGKLQSSRKLGAGQSKNFHTLKTPGRNFALVATSKNSKTETEMTEIHFSFWAVSG